MEWKSYHFDGTAAEIFELFKKKPYTFLLESSLLDPQLGRFSFIGLDPFEVFKSKEDRIDALRDLQEKFSRYAFPSSKSNPITPFPCGIFGYLSYDFGMQFEHIRKFPKKEKDAVPESILGFYDCVITLDHLKHELYICSSGLPEKNLALQRKRAKRRLKEAQKILEPYLQSGVIARSRETATKQSQSKKMPLLRAHLTKPQYFQMVRKALDYIRRGDIYQVNLSQRFSLDTNGLPETIDPCWIYQLLRDLSPSHFSGYFDCGDFQIVSSSPEQFLSLRGRRVKTRPMKGTRPRAGNYTQDQRLKQELKASPKEKAELLMITDLERNDLGRVCDYGSVKVSRMRSLEEYKTVFQATSTIEGKLRKDKTPFDLLRACFPGGSITGCPKIRAMEIIEKLEPVRRGIYTGSMGYVSFTGNMDFNILIRTLLVTARQISFYVGGGIVADSVPPKEYAETLVKAKAMRQCLEQLTAPKLYTFIDGKFIETRKGLLRKLTPGVIKGKGVFETMLACNGHLCLLNWHLDRLGAGLKKLKVSSPYPPSELRHYLKETLRLNGLKNARVRLMVWRDMKSLHTAVIALSYRPLPAKNYKKGFHAVFSGLCCNERSAFANTKSIHYQPFYSAYQQAQAKNYDEAVLLNHKGEIVEGSRSNIFFVKDGVLSTPDLASGCLEGITRRVTLELAKKTGFKVQISGFKPAELLNCEEAFLTNSLWGIMPLTRINHRFVGKGTPGRVTGRLMSLYKRSVSICSAAKFSL